MDCKAYLERIGIHEIPEATAASLAMIQKAHLRSVPYENLDILMKKPIELEAEKLYEKIVVNRRGGYCFEVNELLGWLLRGLGYEVRDLFGRFLRGETGIPMRRHHVLMVWAKDDDVPWILDVGVGSGSPNVPMRLVPGEEVQDGTVTYRFARDDFFGWVLEENKAAQWGPVYCFTEERQATIDFVTTSFWCEHAAESIFNKAAMVSLRTEDGRKTIDGDEARIFEGDQVEVRKIGSWEEKQTILKDWFGIVLPPDARI